jgi:hypothetical protein
MTADCAILEDFLQTVKRCYRMPARPGLTAAAPSAQDDGGSDVAVPDTPANRIAIAIDRAREAIEANAVPTDDIRVEFCEALARLIESAVHPLHGDTGFQALVLQRQSAAVGEYVSLCATQDNDRRTVSAAINAIAHPQKLQRMQAGPLRDAAQQLYQQYAQEAWAQVEIQAHAMASAIDSIGTHAMAHQECRTDALAQRESHAHAIAQQESIRRDPAFSGSVQRLLHGGALSRLQRLATLADHADVKAYRALRQRQGPLAGSTEAEAQGAHGRERGQAVEQRAAQALRLLASRLDTSCEARGRYRVVTSMRSPATLFVAGGHAKAEWDVVLLKRAGPARESAVYSLCLLIEAKASADAATGDMPRLIRGLQGLARARSDKRYVCMTHEGEVTLDGASLAAFATDPNAAMHCVLYCTDDPLGRRVGLLSPGSRMQLLSDECSLAFAMRLQRGDKPGPDLLQSVWLQLLQLPRWQAVLQQYQTMHRVREHMVHIEDLFVAARRV